MKRFKKYCINTICPTNCISMTIIASANRYCYDENYMLPQIQRQIRYKKDGVTNIVATGVIDHPTHSDGECREGGEQYEWESNYTSIAEIINKDFQYSSIIKKVCENLKVSYSEFVKAVKKEIIIQEEATSEIKSIS